ncbi:alpha-1,2-fucosyltransferase [Brachyspira hyodysenteriae]|uniref:alpha-1,2-fucosyltransferase n=1 Tax=Brachyspira hyodysenteriae TaxID=159 RepID=UPI0022CD8263|nr:alpha-1,2-fucosyltransferase [Brachyspira hyodysenteriae]MCZ9982581.1 alpha-1,2-fucosyltransferase [Brachyspira hyodysenteriae]
MNDKYVICSITTGFTDQLINFATAIYIREKYKKNVKLDISWFSVYENTDYLGIEKRNLEVLNIFNDFNFEIATKKEIDIALKSIFIDGRYENIDKILKSNKHIYVGPYVGHTLFYYGHINISSFFNLDKYFINLLNKKHKNILNDMSSFESVAIHIRRGDYMYALKIDGRKNNASLDYIYTSIKYLNNTLENKNIKFYIFSNNKKYIKNNLIPIFQNNNINFEIIEDNPEYIDFYLMTKCKHIISSLGKFAKVAFKFIKNENKIFIDTDNIYNLKKEYFYKNICEKYCNIIYEEYNNIKTYISKNNMIYILDLIEKNNIKNICQIGLLDGLETHTLLKYSAYNNNCFNLLCFENNERDIVGIELKNLTENEKKLFTLYIEQSPLDIDNSFNIKNIDFIFFTKENSNPLVFIYLIYLFPFMKEEIIIVFNDIISGKYYSGSYCIFNMFNGEKNQFYNFNTNKYDNIGYIKIKKQELLNIIKKISVIEYDGYINKFFMNKLIDNRNDYYNYFDLDMSYIRLNNLKQYMKDKFDIEYSNYIISNIENNIINYEKQYYKNQKNNFYSQNQIHISKIENIIDKHNKLINSISWWIPIKKLRENFKNKFIRPDQTRPDQTRPDQTRPNM